MVYASPENMTGLVDIFVYANSVTDNFFGIGILISLYLIVVGFLSTKGEDIMSSMMVGGYITTITSLLLFLMGLITGLPVFICIMGVVIPAVWGYWSKS